MNNNQQPDAFDRIAALQPISQPTVLVNTKPGVDVTPEAKPTRLNGVDTLGYIKTLFEPGDWVSLMFLLEGTETVQHEYMTLEDALRPTTIDLINDYQEKGWHAYVGMNSFTTDVKNRTKKDVKAIRNVYIDIDDSGSDTIDRITNDAEAGVVPNPHFILRSSESKFYAIWRVEDFSVPEQENVNTALQERYNSDPAAKDAARVLRLPGSINLKAAYTSKPVVKILEQNDGPRYPLAAFKTGVRP